MIVLIILVTLMVKLRRSDRRRNNRDRQRATNNSQPRNEPQNRYQPELDLPPDYDTVGDNPVFVIDAQSFYSTDGLPTYEEAKEAAIKVESGLVPNPPAYDVITSNENDTNSPQQNAPAVVSTQDENAPVVVNTQDVNITQ